MDLRGARMAVAALLLVALLSAGQSGASRLAPHHKQIRRDERAREQRAGLTEQAEWDLVPELPGWGAVAGFRLFSGYVTVDALAGRHLAYIFAESQGDASTDPLVLWLNGGPGCSSFGGGFLSELGPWLPKPGGTELQANAYSWNREASVLFVESPAFVGFSYSETSSDAYVGDARTAKDMHAFLLGFFQRFPHLADLDLYVSGESYAGHYVPQLAWEIVQGNKRALQQAPPAPPTELINFKGVLLGNPWTDAATDNLGAVDFWWHHALLSDETALGIKANCDFARIGPLDPHPSTSNPHTRSGACDHFCNVAQAELGPINIYEIFADLCPDGNGDGTRQSRVVQALAYQLAAPRNGTLLHAGGGGVPVPLLSLQAALSGRASAARAARPTAGSPTRRRLHEDDPDADKGVPGYDPCVDLEVATYLNLPQVQKALHLNVSGDLPGPWQDCTFKISYSREDLLSSILPLWKKLIAVPGLKFIVYSGDVDGIVPVVGTRRWVASLGLPVVRAWRPWISGPAANPQVGGYTVEFKLPWQNEHHGQEAAAATESSALRGAFVFATVRNAGHMVPYVQPQRALHLLTRFLDDQAL